jgi:hypothetical protein
MLQFEPMLVNDLTLKELPSVAKFSTEIPEATCILPNTLKADPNLTAERIESDEATCTKSNTEHDDPNLKQLIALNELPSLAAALMLRQEPASPIPNMDKFDPKYETFHTLRVDPILPKLLTEQVLPRLTKSNVEIADPILPQDLTEIVEPKC